MQVVKTKNTTQALSKVVKRERSVRGMVERFIKKNLSPRRLETIFNTLTAKEKIDVLILLMPYAIAKQKEDGLSREEVDQIYEKMQELLKQPQHGKVG